MELRQDFRESCRVCKSRQQDNDFESLFTVENGQRALSAFGLLYEESLAIKIELNSEEFFPQYLCNSCELQMKLFQKLKTKAKRTLEELKEHYDTEFKKSQNNTVCLEEIMEDEIGQSTNDLRDIAEYETQQKQYDASVKTSQNNTVGLEEIIEDNIGQSTKENLRGIEEYETQKEQYDDASVKKSHNIEGLEDEFGQSTTEELRDIEEYDDASMKKSHNNTMHLEEIIEDEIGQSTEDELKHIAEYETQYLENENISEIEEKFKAEETCYSEEEFLVEERPPSATHEEVAGANEVRKLEEYDVAEMNNYDLVEYFHPGDDDDKIFEINENSSVNATDNHSDYTEVYYLDDVVNEQEDKLKKPLPLPKKKKKSPPDWNCYSCGSIFPNRIQLSDHRREIHSNQNPCPVCQKLLKTPYALLVHLQQHQGKPAYKCELCKKTFNQKVHYKYHMDGHNNVRNFKCDQCEKAFLSKADLSIHTRSHNSDRRYGCDICGKDFLMLQHLKMHRYSHVVGKSFECEICKQKLVSPATLRTHIQTVHGKTRQYECEFCTKKFRRKHHLLAHYKIHQKPQILQGEETQQYEDNLVKADQIDDVTLIDADQIIYNANEDDDSDNSVLKSPYKYELVVIN